MSSKRFYGVHCEDINSAQFADQDETKGPVETWHRIFPDGDVFHPSSEDALTLGDKFRAGIITEFERAGLKVPLDFNHLSSSTTLKTPSKEEGSAPGWIFELEDREADGLWAHIRWNSDGLEAIRTEAYQYLSPDFSLLRYDKSTGEVVEQPRLMAVALVNRPHFDNQEPLAASDAEPVQTAAEVAQPEDDKLSDVSTAADDAAKENETLRAQLAESEEKNNTALAELAESKKVFCDQAVAAATLDGRVTAPMLDSVKAFREATGDNVEALSGWLSGLPKQTRPEREGGAPLKDETKEAEAVTLSDGEAKVATAFKLTDAEYLKYGRIESQDAEGNFLDADGKVVN